MESFDLTENSELQELTHSFSMDELDVWTTTTGLVQSIISVTEKSLPNTAAYLFYHEIGLHEYREINREGIATIPDDSLFIGCLSMISEPMPLADFFSEYHVEEPILKELFNAIYHAHTIVPIVHRFDLLAFMLICTKDDKLVFGEPMPQLAPEATAFLKDLSERVRTNLFAASVADLRQRELLNMTRYPLALQKHKTISDVYSNLLKDIGAEITFDRGVCYAYEQERESLVPFSFFGIEQKPPKLALGKGISGQVFESQQALFVPERISHPSYAIMEEEPFIDGSFISVPLSTDKTQFGVITLVRSIQNQKPFGVEHRYMLEIAAAFAASEITSRQLYARLDESNFNVVKSLTRALEAKDVYTEGHSARVTTYSEAIGRELGYDEQRIHQLRYGAMLHDIGKIGISNTIINKQSRLTEEEYAEIKQHTEIGYKIVKDNPFFKKIRDFIRYHHETLLGTGYYGKENDEIPEEAMIISAADIFDALTSDRPYRVALPMKEAITELQKQTNIHFTKKILDAFLVYLEREKPVP
ncbi:MAG: HD domain-containing protein [Treponema sp.]|nr:HD domain-containing protein [Treponema sp.]